MTIFTCTDRVASLVDIVDELEIDRVKLGALLPPKPAFGVLTVGPEELVGLLGPMLEPGAIVAIQALPSRTRISLDLELVEEDFLTYCNGNGTPDADEFKAYAMSLPGAPSPSHPNFWAWIIYTLQVQMNESQGDSFDH